jgi:hypothetical protein
MKFALLKIVLWPRDSTASYRVLSFTPGKLNVITGASKTGKSAIIPIVDYCLASDACSIPVKTIRDTCSWFGILIQLDHGQMLLARREPGSQKTTGDMFVQEGDQVLIPEAVERNTTADAVKLRLDELAGLTKLDFSAQDVSDGFRGRPSFRDMAAFMFQPQNVVANPDVLFYKADTYEHREKLRTIFPYVLGVITSRVLSLQHQLGSLRAALRAREREQQLLSSAVERWVSELRSRVSTASELGLVGQPPSANASVHDLIDLLRGAVSDRSVRHGTTQESVSGAVQELVALEQEENGMAEELAVLRRRLTEMTRLRESATYYGEALKVKRDRLRLSDWLAGLYTTDKQCPLCGSDETPYEEELKRLVGALEMAERESGQFGEMPASFEREFVRVTDDVRRVTQSLEAVKYRRQQRAVASRSLQERYYTEKNLQRFIGATQESLSRYDSMTIDRRLEAEIESLAADIRGIETELAKADIQRNLQRALLKISNLNNHLVPQLDVERPGDPVQLDIGELAIKVSSLDRDDFLWEIGSGANWVGYHVSMALALQQFFIDQQSSPVPAMLVFDQPSQVYFPRRLARNEVDESDPKLERDEDVEAVRKIFSVIARQTMAAGGRLQTIILDHATQEIWGGIEGAVLVEEWRDGKKLVPTAWIS